jgi:hypothetical protein
MKEEMKWGKRSSGPTVKLAIRTCSALSSLVAMTRGTRVATELDGRDDAHADPERLN